MRQIININNKWSFRKGVTEPPEKPGIINATPIAQPRNTSSKKLFTPVFSFDTLSCIMLRNPFYRKICYLNGKIFVLLY